MAGGARPAYGGAVVLIRKADLDRIVAGEVSLQFRRWRRPTVKAGGTLTTQVGVLDVLSVDAVALRSISREDALAAGFASKAALKAALEGREGTLYRVGLRYRGEDPRIALRADAETDLDQVRVRLARMDAASSTGAWTRTVLALVRDHEGVRAPDLAPTLGLEIAPFKARVRRLKALGLTESLRVGYRLSPRGRAVLEALDAAS